MSRPTHDAIWEHLEAMSPGDLRLAVETFARMMLRHDERHPEDHLEWTAYMAETYGREFAVRHTLLQLVQADIEAPRESVGIEPDEDAA